MREIKFRVFDKAKSQMYYLLKNRYSFGPCEEIRAVSWEDVFADQHEELIPLQYIGLKDINGVEIYEGDIVKAFGGKLYPVVYEDFMFNLPNYYDGSADYPTIAFSEGVFEVVGNIFEHVHLLEGE